MNMIQKIAEENPITAAILANMFVTASNAYVGLPPESRPTDKDMMDLLHGLESPENLMEQMKRGLQEKLGVSDALEPPVMPEGIKLTEYFEDFPMSFSVRAFVEKQGGYKEPDVGEVMYWMKTHDTDPDYLKQDVRHYLFAKMVQSGLAAALVKSCEEQYFIKDGKPVLGEDVFKDWNPYLDTTDVDKVVFNGERYDDLTVLLSDMNKKLEADFQVEAAEIPLITDMKADERLPVYQPVTIGILSNMEDKEARELWTLISALDSDDEARLDDEFVLETISQASAPLDYEGYANLLKTEVAYRLEVLSRNVVYHYNLTEDETDQLAALLDNIRIYPRENGGFEIEQDSMGIPFHNAGGFFYALNQYLSQSSGLELDGRELVDEMLTLHQFPQIPENFEIIDGFAYSGGIEPVLEFLNQHSPNAAIGDLDLLGDMVALQGVNGYNRELFHRVFARLEDELPQAVLAAACERCGQSDDAVSPDLMHMAYEEWQPEISVSNYSLTINGREFKGEADNLAMGLEHLTLDLFNHARKMIEPKIQAQPSLKP